MGPRRRRARGHAEEAINDLWGSTEEQARYAGGVNRFGSGWTGSSTTHRPAVKSTPNQDSPFMDGDVPLLGIDVWEHAYYLNYQNRRPTTSRRGGTCQLGRGRPPLRRRGRP